MLVALLLVLSASPQATLKAVNAQETLNDQLENHFDAICGALKAGRRTLTPDLVAEGVHFPVEAFVQVPSCSLRALSIGAAVEGELPLRLLWDLDGRDASGRRISVRNESDGAVKKVGKKWLLTKLDVANPRRVEREGPRFSERAVEAGLVFPERATFSMPAEFLASGLTVRDIDRDGLPDVFLIDGGNLYLYRGRPGLRFAAPSLIARAPKDKTLSNAALGDFDGDGDADLVVTTYRDVPVRTFRNDDGQFVEGPRVGRGGHHQTAIPSDLDGDGRLDLAIAAYPLEGRVPSSYLQADNGEPPELWLGNADFTFRRLEIPPGVARRHWSFGGVAADLLGTGRMQLYVVNDYGVKDLYVFEPDGGVSEGATQAGLTDPGPGMSVDLGDMNQDGRLDVYVANMFSKAGTRIMNGVSGIDPGMRDLLVKFVRGNTLFMSQADGGYLDQAESLQVHRALWSFASLLTDIDNDSQLEVLVANGFVSAPIRKDL